MKISATAQGGFTGKGEYYEIDTATNRRGRALEAALADYGFFNARSAGAPAVGADILLWTISADDGARRNSISFREDGRGDSRHWASLLNQIRSAA